MIFLLEYSKVIKMTMKKVLGCIRKADEEFNLIQDGDKVCGRFWW